MRLLYAFPAPPGELRRIGTGECDLKKNREFFLFSMVSLFSEKGNDIVLVGEDRHIKETEEYTLPGLKVYIVSLWKHGRISAFDAFRTDVRRIYDIIKREECDIYHAHWCYEYAAACLKAHPEKTIVTMHDWPDYVCRMLGNYYWEQKRRLANKVVKEGIRFTAVSPYIKKLVEEVNHTAEISVIPNFFCEDELKKFESNKLQKGEAFTVICVNNGFHDRKNTKNAMAAFGLFHKKYPHSELGMYGEGYEPEGKANQWAKTHIDCDGIRFHGRKCREEIAEIFGLADVLLHTSLEESFGLIYLEAMASKTAIIAGKDAGATAWVLEEGKAAELVDIQKVDDVSEALEKLYMSREYRNQLVENGQNRLKFFYADKIFRMYEKEYQRVAEKNQA